MKQNNSNRGRATAAALACVAGLAITSFVTVTGSSASAQGSAECVRYDADDVGSKEVSTGVTVKVAKWTNSLNGFDYTVSGLSGSQELKIRVYDVEDGLVVLTKTANGSGKYRSKLVGDGPGEDIDRVTFCVSGTAATTTTTTTTTTASTTTTTTIAATTTTKAAATTTKAKMLPKTGLDGAASSGLVAMVLVGLGAAMVLGSRSTRKNHS